MFLARKDFWQRSIHPAWESHYLHLLTIDWRMSAWNWYRLEVLCWMRQRCRRFERRKKQRHGVMYSWKSTLSSSGFFRKWFSAQPVHSNQPGGLQLSIGLSHEMSHARRGNEGRLGGGLNKHACSGIEQGSSPLRQLSFPRQLRQDADASPGAHRQSSAG